MRTVNTVDALHQTLAGQRRVASRVGFVPTMGALHAGHISLVEKARVSCDVVVVSIFINPTQFNDPKDLAAYPKTLDSDLAMLTVAGCHVAFVPSVQEVYPPGSELETYDFGRLEHILEGTVRPGHFRGMAQVVARLLRIVEPQAIYMGQKDYQQYIIVKNLVAHKLRLKTEVVLCPIVREADGLAMSSRNVRLSPMQRQDAVELSRTLFWIREQVGMASPLDLVHRATERLHSIASVTGVDYVQIADPVTLQPIQFFNASIIQSSIALAAIRMEGVRLIDNVML